MSHPRQQIRDALVTALQALPVTAYNVIPSRVYRIDDTQLPAITIDMPRDVVTGEASGGIRTHELTVELGVHVKAPGDGPQSYYQTLDEACADIEAAMTDSLGLTLLSVRLQGTEVEYDAELEQPRAMARMQYAVQYRVNRLAPETLV